MEHLAKQEPKIIASPDNPYTKLKPCLFCPKYSLLSALIANAKKLKKNLQDALFFI